MTLNERASFLQIRRKRKIFLCIGGVKHKCQSCRVDSLGGPINERQNRQNPIFKPNLKTGSLLLETSLEGDHIIQFVAQMHNSKSYQFFGLKNSIFNVLGFRYEVWGSNLKEQNVEKNAAFS